MIEHGQHDHHGHDHPRIESGNERRLVGALVLIGGFMVIEAAGGLYAGSLALLADAGHMLTDTAALGLSWLAFRAGRLPADERKSYGHHRFQVLAAFLNGVTLIAITVWITVEAIGRIMTPIPVLGGPMFAVALAGLAANAAALGLLYGGDRADINMRSAVLHVIGDLIGFVATIAAALVIMFTGWMPIDPLLSLLVAGLIARGAWSIIRQSWHVLMEGTPANLDIGRLRHELMSAVPEVQNVHHVHAWSLTPGQALVTLHAHVVESADQDEVLHRMHRLLAERFAIGHATIQLERGRCVDPDHEAAREN